MASIKISYDREIRRVPLREDGSAFTLTKLMNTLYNLFPALTGKNFSLTWEDEEGDEVICSSDAELDDAIHVMRAMGKVLRFTVKLNEKTSTAEVPKTPAAAERINFVHAGVTCDECGVKPIVGIRYKCAIRNDFDLCETCEAKRIQPFPMIKIVDPAQAPQVLVYGLPDGTRNDEGAWQRGWRHSHHPPHHPPHGGHPHCPPPFGPPPHFGGRGGGPFPHPHGPGPFGGRGHPLAEGFGHCRRRCDRWARKFAENVAKEAAPFVAAMDQVFGAEAVPSAQATPAPANNEDAQLEEQLIEKAILESLVINESQQQKPSTETPAVPSETATPVAPPVNPYVETAKPANPTLPKPALRFVKDVTFPDGTIVQPGAKFRKAWKVRNDGSHPWPQGAALVSVGGDVMGDPSLKEALPSVAPEKEAEIAVQLTAPQAPGMYTGYYRAQTKEQQYFGQRLWASIVVADQEPEWQVVTENPPSTTTTSPTPSVPAVPVVTSPTPIPTHIPGEEVKKPAEPVLPVSDPAPTPTAPTPVAPSAPVFGTFTAAPVAPVEVPVVAPVPVGPPAHLRSAILLWRRELEVLSEMGFSDPEMVLPLLTQHLGSPVSLSGDKNARPNAEGMQQVIATLLSLSN